MERLIGELSESLVQSPTVGKFKSLLRGRLSSALFCTPWLICLRTLPAVCIHPSAKVDFNTEASGKKEARLIMAWHACLLTPRESFCAHVGSPLLQG